MKNENLISIESETREKDNIEFSPELNGDFFISIDSETSSENDNVEIPPDLDETELKNFFEAYKGEENLLWCSNVEKLNAFFEDKSNNIYLPTLTSSMLCSLSVNTKHIIDARNSYPFTPYVKRKDREVTVPIKLTNNRSSLFKYINGYKSNGNLVIENKIFPDENSEYGYSDTMEILYNTLWLCSNQEIYMKKLSNKTLLELRNYLISIEEIDLVNKVDRILTDQV